MTFQKTKSWLLLKIFAVIGFLMINVVEEALWQSLSKAAKYVPTLVSCVLTWEDSRQDKRLTKRIAKLIRRKGRKKKGKGESGSSGQGEWQWPLPSQGFLRISKSSCFYLNFSTPLMCLLQLWVALSSFCEGWMWHNFSYKGGSWSPGRVWHDFEIIFLRDVINYGRRGLHVVGPHLPGPCLSH